jgi:cell division protein FtsW
MSIALHADATEIDSIDCQDDATVERQASGWARSVMIIATAVGLMGVGAVMTFSASARIDAPLETSLWESRVFRQMVFTAAGLMVMLIVARIPYRIWTAGDGLAAVVGLLAAIATASLVFVPGIGVKRNEAYRWVGIAGEKLVFQPSELVKIMLPVFLACWMTRRLATRPETVADLFRPHERADIRSFRRGFVPAVIAIGLAVGVVGIEDFGTAALLAAVGGAMLLVGGARITHILLLVLPAVPAFGYLLFSRAHRMSRLLTFLNIWEDPEFKGYQAIQSLCTIVSGGFFGRGLGRGFVKGYLPEARTDFIFSVICEELGVIGAVAVIALLVAFLWQCRLILRDCADPTGKLLCFGIAMTFGVQAAMNIAVVTVSMPTKGISLPLVSAGGSGVIFLGVLVGMLASVPRYGGMALGGAGR